MGEAESISQRIQECIMSDKDLYQDILMYKVGQLYSITLSWMSSISCVYSGTSEIRTPCMGPCKNVLISEVSLIRRFPYVHIL